jgi:hypothetical protein
VTIDRLVQRAELVGLAVRGAFHPNPDEFKELRGMEPGTVVLLGFTGSLQWPRFAASAEAADGLPHPLDRWSRRVIGELAIEFNARDVYPSGSPILPFQRLASRCESVHPSPIGLLIHTEWGLWHAYRGALIFPQRLTLSGLASTVSPCHSCQEKPCLHTCPVGAFNAGRFDLHLCARHVASEAGSDCRELGCRARRACPVGSQFGYVAEQAQFHMRAFLLSFPKANQMVTPIPPQ